LLHHKESRAKLLILLGDKPIEESLRYYFTCERLSQLTDNGENYGKIISVNIDGYSVDILPLVHPCQDGGIMTTSMWAINNMWQ
jgi:hypothetical protein